MKEQEQQKRRKEELAELIKRGQAMEKDLEAIRKQLAELQRQIAQLEKPKGNERKMRGSRALASNCGWNHSGLWFALYYPALLSARCLGTSTAVNDCPSSSTRRSSC